MSAVAGPPLSDAVQALVTLLGGAAAARRMLMIKGPAPQWDEAKCPSTRSPESGESHIWNQMAIGPALPAKRWSLATPSRVPQRDELRQSPDFRIVLRPRRNSK